MLDGFKKFILRGNVVDMAVGVVIGAAFGSVVTSLTKGLLTPFIGAVVKLPDFSNLKYGNFLFGDFINAVISFLLIAAAVYFFVVVPVNWLMARMHTDEPAGAPTTRKCPECLSDIPLEARRCSHCTQVVLARVA